MKEAVDYERLNRFICSLCKGESMHTFSYVMDGYPTYCNHCGKLLNIDEDSPYWIEDRGRGRTECGSTLG